MTAKCVFAREHNAQIEKKGVQKSWQYNNSNEKKDRHHSSNTLCYWFVLSHQDIESIEKWKGKAFKHLKYYTPHIFHHRNHWVNIEYAHRTCDSIYMADFMNSTTTANYALASILNNNKRMGEWGEKKPTMLIAYMLVDTVSIHSKEQYEMAMVCVFFFSNENGNINTTQRKLKWHVHFDRFWCDACYSISHT